MRDRTYDSARIKRRRGFALPPAREREGDRDRESDANKSRDG